MSFFSQLRQRRLFQILFAYIAGGWIVLEAISQLVQHGILPELGYQLGLVWFVAGIPAAGLIGWHHGEKGKQRAPLSEALIIGLIALTVLGFSGFQVVDHVSEQRAISAARASALDLDRVAVLYFEDHSPDEDLQHIADGLTESLIQEFSKVRNLEVVSRGGVGHFRGSNAPPDSIAAALKAGTLVQGDIRKVGDRLRVNVSLLEGETGAPFGRRASFERPAGNFFEVQEELAAEVSRLMREWLGGEVSLRRIQQETSSQAAWVLYQRAEKARKDAEGALLHHDEHSAAAHFDRADSLLDQVELLDPAWPAPFIMRGELDYRRARLSHDRHASVALLDEGLRHVADALELEPENAQALGMRGILRYFKYLQDIIPDHDLADALRGAAQADMERAVDLDPTQAGVWSALQHLYVTSVSITDAVMAGERAYEEDAYLEAADAILWRLYTGHYDLGNFTKALQWCEEGARRFPALARFASCQLELLHTPALAPDPDRAWQLATLATSLAADHDRDYASVEADLFAAAVLARAELPDSARAVLRRAHDRITPEIDPSFELLTVEAAVWSMLGQDDHAIDLLKRHRTAVPDASFEHHWWWRTVRSHPRYSEIAPEHH